MFEARKMNASQSKLLEASRAYFVSCRTDRNPKPCKRRTNIITPASFFPAPINVSLVLEGVCVKALCTATDDH